ncbi:tetratricopeptide repeat protein, partial [Candidatus Sumerlaeota bacterium]|nr:tetratricopeptide repeat protein [Candidatus Sumerlaeota bacterium]
DDDYYVTKNDTLRDLDGLWRIWFVPGSVPQYYPLVHTAFWIENHLWGIEHPRAFHAVNIVLHGISGVMLWIILSRLGLRGSWFAAAFFLVHPVQVESVAWITERKNVLAGFFLMVSLIPLTSFFDLAADSSVAPEAHSAARPRSVALYFLGLLFFICSLLSKTVTFSMPAVLGVLIWWRRGRWTRKEIAYLVPLILVGVCMGSVTAWMEAHRVGAKGADFEWPFLHRVLIAGRAIWFYAGKLLCPSVLTFIYPRWKINSYAPGQYVFPFAVLGCLVLLWALRGRIGRGPLAAALIFAGSLFPALGFINVYPMKFSYAADHFQYLSTIPILAGASFLLARKGAFGRGLSAVLLVLMMFLTFRQTRVYEYEEALWRDAYFKNPASWMNSLNLGLILGRSPASMDESMRLISQAFDLEPGLDRKIHANVRDLLAAMLFMRRDYDRAVGLYRSAAEDAPDNADAQYKYAFALLAAGRDDEAASKFEAIVARWPRHAESYYRLAQIQRLRGELDLAASSVDKALEMNRRFPGAWIEKAEICIKQNRLDDAREFL